MRILLSSLHIENIAVIKSADIEISSGFSVLTGETGAGKSIIIDSINLICGAKQSRELIRSGEESAKVSAMFEDIGETRRSALEALGIVPDEDGVVMIERTITQSGKSTVRSNGRAVPLSAVREGMKYLIAIHGQHDNMALLDSTNHIGYLDEYADIAAELAEYSAVYKRFTDIKRQIAELTVGEREKAQRLEFLKYRIAEIEAAKLKDGEEEKLLARRKKLQNAEKIAQLADSVYSLLYRNEKSTAAYDKVKKASRSVESLAPVLDGADELIARLDGVLSELEDIALTVDALRDGDADDPTAELDKVESRLDMISRMERKYGDTVAEVLKFLESAKEELAGIEMSEERLSELESEKKTVLASLTALAAKLTEKRAEAAERLERDVEKELSYLEMGGVKFESELKIRLSDDGESGFCPNGADNVEFLIATNKGEPPKPLSKIASGGELSRIMLALKTVLARCDSPGTLIFDEVDTGVSGKTSEKIGIKLRELARLDGSQVLCVTHSAQIAARAENHYLISKREEGGRVSTTVTELDLDGRVSEVARIMGGINITDRIMETAREMIVGI